MPSGPRIRKKPSGLWIRKKPPDPMSSSPQPSADFGAYLDILQDSLEFIETGWHFFIIQAVPALRGNGRPRLAALIPAALAAAAGVSNGELVRHVLGWVLRRGREPPAAEPAAALHRAAARGNTRIFRGIRATYIKMWHDEDRIPLEEYKNLLKTAARHGRRAIIQYLLQIHHEAPLVFPPFSEAASIAAGEGHAGLAHWLADCHWRATRRRIYGRVAIQGLLQGSDETFRLFMAVNVLKPSETAEIAQLAAEHGGTVGAAVLRGLRRHAAPLSSAAISGALEAAAARGHGEVAAECLGWLWDSLAAGVLTASTRAAAAAEDAGHLHLAHRLRCAGHLSPQFHT